MNDFDDTTTERTDIRKYREWILQINGLFHQQDLIHADIGPKIAKYTEISYRINALIEQKQELLNNAQNEVWRNSEVGKLTIDAPVTRTSLKEPDYDKLYGIIQ